MLRETGVLIQLTARPGFQRPRRMSVGGRRADVADFIDHIETYLKVRGRWCYLHRAIDRDGNLIDALARVSTGA